MLHDILFYLHLLGMAIVVGSGLYLLAANPAQAMQNKMSVYLISAAHTQLLTGLILFLMGLDLLNPVKYGVKIILVIVLVVVATIYMKNLKAGKTPSFIVLPLIVLLSLAITAIAFFW